MTTTDMRKNVIIPNDLFLFSSLSLKHPISGLGGSYFTKLECNHKPLYVQTDVCQTKQGIVTTGKRTYCDLIFDKNAESFLNWMEGLEKTCIQLIYNKRMEWFQDGLELSDIESAFNSAIKVHKSNHYLVRAYMLADISIYDESQCPKSVTDINPETSSLTGIIEILGIKFTPRSFQIEIELKQIMIMNTSSIRFNQCMIQTATTAHKEQETAPPVHVPSVPSVPLVPLVPSVPLVSFAEFKEVIDIDEKEEDDKEKKEEEEEIQLDEVEELNDNPPLIEINELDEPSDNDPYVLKQPAQIYMEMYVQARAKAKQLKRTTIEAYLEAKRMKQKYSLELAEGEGSDAELDAEIDEVSESELD